MKDQAEKLRMKLQNHTKKLGKTIAVVSGKGGVGKSNISINLALNLADKGNRVLLFDFDIGMGNVNILLGSTANFNITHFLHEKMPLKSIINEATDRVSYISAGNGLNEVVHMNEQMMDRLLEGLGELQTDFDYIIFDMAAGATSTALHILLSVEDIIIICTPEPTALTDAYSMMKYICSEEPDSRFFLICNRADSVKQGNDTLARLQATARKFLNKEVMLLGTLPEDKHVRKAVINQTAFSKEYPRADISIQLKKIVDLYLSGDRPDLSEVNPSFLQKLRGFFTNKEERL